MIINHFKMSQKRKLKWRGRIRKHLIKFKAYRDMERMAENNPDKFIKNFKRRQVHTGLVIGVGTGIGLISAAIASSINSKL
jgi:hypothetical protein